MQFRKRSFLLIPVTSLFLLAGCKKDEQKIPPPVIPKVKTLTKDNNVQTYSYDSKGRVTKVDYGPNRRDEYAYTDTSVVYNSYDAQNILQLTTNYKLNDRGFAISSTSNSPFTESTTFAYASDAQPLTNVLTRTIQNGPVIKFTTQSYYTNSILDSIVGIMTTDNLFSGSSNYYYDEYFTDKINTVGNVNLGQQWLGLSSKHPVKTARDIGHDNNWFYTQTTYTYEYDSLNRITVVHHYNGTDEYPPTSYTYY